MSNLFAELKRRNVFRVGLAYAFVGWLLVQVADALFPALLLPEWSTRLVVAFLIIGFPVALLFAWAFEITPEGVKREAEVDRAASITPQTGRKLDFVIIGALTLALGYFAYDKFTDEMAPPVAGDGEKSVAVLPFVNMSSDPEQEYFSDGISEELLNVLAKIPGLRVAARTSSFAFKGENRDVQEIGEKLRVATVLEGSVRKSGTRLRITAQLIDVASGFHLWSEIYERELTDIFAVQDDISRAIAAALKVHLTAAGDDAPVVRATNVDAYNLYLLGRHHLEMRKKDELEKAQAFFERAIELDAEYAPAYTGLAECHIFLSDHFGSYGDVPWEQAIAKAVPLISKAIALDPVLPDAHASLGLARFIEGDYVAAEAALKRALELNPNLARVYLWLFVVYDSTKRYQESFSALGRMLELDPLSVIGHSNMGWELVRRRQLSAGEDHFRKIIELAPESPQGYGGLGLVHLVRGELARAVGRYREALAVAPSSRWDMLPLGGVLLHLHEYREAERYLKDRLDLVFLAEGRLNDAVAAARARLALRPDDAVTIQAAARAELWAGNHGAARRLLEAAHAGPERIAESILTAIPNEATTGFVNLAIARAATGDAPGALEILAEVRSELEARREAGFNEWGSTYLEARLLALWGQGADALAALRAAVGEGGPFWFVASDPAFESLRGDPGFEEIVADINSRAEAERAKLAAALKSPE